MPSNRFIRCHKRATRHVTLLGLLAPPIDFARLYIISETELGAIPAIDELFPRKHICMQSYLDLPPLAASDTRRDGVVFDYQIMTTNIGVSL